MLTRSGNSLFKEEDCLPFPRRAVLADEFVLTHKTFVYQLLERKAC